jgi:hypothetical protein
MSNDEEKWLGKDPDIKQIFIIMRMRFNESPLNFDFINLIVMPHKTACSNAKSIP